MWLAVVAACVSSPFLQMVSNADGQELPLTRNVPISEFQNRLEDIQPYNFDAPPAGMFRSSVLSDSFEEEMGVQRTHEIVPINPTDQFHADSTVFIVFKLH